MALTSGEPMATGSTLHVPPYPPARIAWSTVAILLIFYMLAYLDRQILSLLAIPIQQDLGLDDVQLGLLNGFSFVLLYAFAGFVMGWLVDSFPRRPILFAGVFIWSISCMACGLANSFGTLFLARVGVGAAEAALVPAVYSMLRDLFPPSRLALANGVFVTGGSLGIGLSFAAGGALIAWFAAGPVTLAILGELRGWQSAFIIAGLPGVVFAFLIYLVPEPARRGRPRVRSEGVVAPMIGFIARRPRALTSHLLGTSLSAMCAYSTYAWAPIFLGRQFGTDMLTIGIGMGLAVGPCAMIGSITAGIIVDRGVRRGLPHIHFRIMALTLVGVACACVGAFTIASGFAQFVLIAAGIGFGVGLIGAVTPAALQMMAPASLRGQLGAAYLLVSSLLGAGLGPLLIGVLTEHVFADKSMVGVSIAIVSGTGGLLGALLLWTGRHAFADAIRDADD